MLRASSIRVVLSQQLLLHVLYIRRTVASGQHCRCFTSSTLAYLTACQSVVGRAVCMPASFGSQEWVNDGRFCGWFVEAVRQGFAPHVSGSSSVAFLCVCAGCQSAEFWTAGILIRLEDSGEVVQRTMFPTMHDWFCACSTAPRVCVSACVLLSMQVGVCLRRVCPAAALLCAMMVERVCVFDQWMQGLYAALTAAVQEIPGGQMTPL